VETTSAARKNEKNIEHRRVDLPNKHRAHQPPTTSQLSNQDDLQLITTAVRFSSETYGARWMSAVVSWEGTLLRKSERRGTALVAAADGIPVMEG
jgi:hypothetical protein